MTLWASNARSVRECSVRRTRSYRLASQLVRMWHSLLPSSPPGFRVAFVAYAPNLAPVAVAMWGRPIARLEDQVRTLELSRQAHSPDAPRNTGSWFLARMREYIRKNMPEIVRLISYQDADVHNGTIYKADNWKVVYEKHSDHVWTNRADRQDSARQHKIKWERKP